MALKTRGKRLGVVAGYAAPPGPERPEPAPERHDHPGEPVQMDCFPIGWLAGTRGTLWHYTAIDMANSFVWV